MAERIYIHHDHPKCELCKHLIKAAYDDWKICDECYRDLSDEQKQILWQNNGRVDSIKE